PRLPADRSRGRRGRPAAGPRDPGPGPAGGRDRPARGGVPPVVAGRAAAGRSAAAGGGGGRDRGRVRAPRPKAAEATCPGRGAGGGRVGRVGGGDVRESRPENRLVRRSHVLSTTPSMSDSRRSVAPLIAFARAWKDGDCPTVETFLSKQHPAGVAVDE